MNGSNGEKKQQGSNILSLEMEQLHPEPTTVRYPQKLSLIDQIIMLAKLYMESYPRVTSILGFVIFVFAVYATVVYSKPPMKRNQLAHEYKDIDRTYNWKLAQMDHWCLFVSYFVYAAIDGFRRNKQSFDSFSRPTLQFYLNILIIAGR